MAHAIRATLWAALLGLVLSGPVGVQAWLSALWAEGSIMDPNGLQGDAGGIMDPNG